MPEIGGSKLATNFSSMMADVRKEIDAATAKVAAAVSELKFEITSGAQIAAKAIRAEAATVRSGYSELLGNNPPSTVAPTVVDGPPTAGAIGIATPPEPKDAAA